MKHDIVPTIRNNNTVTPAEKSINPTKVTVSSEDNLDFLLGTATNENDVYVYFMQVCPLQQDLTTEPVSENINKSSDLIPPRILQSVHGFFQLKNHYPTRLNMTASWDKETVINYCIAITSFYKITLADLSVLDFIRLVQPGKEKIVFFDNLSM